MMGRMIVDNAIYVEGRRTEQPRSLKETYEAVRQRQGVAWVGLYKPTEEEFGSVAGERSSGCTLWPWMPPSRPTSVPS